MNRQKLLAQSIRESRTLLMRYARGFDDANRATQAPTLPNHFAWTMGHLALYLHRSGERIDARPLPESDFVKGDGRSGSADRFDTESISMNSTPQPDATLYPPAARCVAIFDAAIERCARAFETASDEVLDSPAKWGTVEIPMWLVAIRMVFHNGTHTGQLADLRRALGMGSIFA